MTWRREWKLAFWFAIVAALAAEISINIFREHTVWHRLNSIEQKVDRIEQMYPAHNQHPQ